MKRYIKSAYYDPYGLGYDSDDIETDFIDESVPQAVTDFISCDQSNMDIDDLYRAAKAACDVFWEDYKKFPNGNTMESLDSKYDDDKGRFYTKYRPFADKCKELENIKNVSGYGGVRDVIKIKLGDLCGRVTYNFPYGWKYNAR